MNPVDVAIELKKEKIAFYRNAVETCSYPAGRKMFLIVLEDEERHLEGLNRMRAAATMDASKLGSGEGIGTALKTVRKEMGAEDACTLDEMEAFRVAMEKEKEAFDLFTRKAAEARDGGERAVFEKLARDESEHHEVFSNTNSFLEDTGNWFMWREYSIVEG